MAFFQSLDYPGGLWTGIGQTETDTLLDTKNVNKNEQQTTDYEWVINRL